MRVICIDNSPGRLGFASTHLIEGETYTASPVPFFDDRYALAEVPFLLTTGEPIFFYKRRFVPLNGPCEKEILAERVEQACAEVTALYEGIPEPAVPDEVMARMWERVMHNLKNNPVI